MPVKHGRRALSNVQRMTRIYRRIHREGANPKYLNALWQLEDRWQKELDRIYSLLGGGFVDIDREQEPVERRYERQRETQESQARIMRDLKR